MAANDKVIITKNKLDQMADNFKVVHELDHNPTLDEMIELANTETGVDTSDATAVASAMLAGQTAYVNGEKIEGTIETYDGSTVNNINYLNLDIYIGVLENPIDLIITNLDSLRSYAFYGNPNICSIYSECANFRDNAVSVFENCSQLVSVDLPNVTILQSKTFNNCVSLSNINMPNLIQINSYALGYCGIESIDLPQLQYINGGFEYCSASTYNIPNVVSISSNSFRSSNVTSLYLPNLNTLGTNAFYQARNLTKLHIGIVNTIPRRALYSNNALTDIYSAYDGVIVLEYASDFSTVGTYQGYVNLHVKPNLDLATQYAEASNWSSLIANGQVIIIEDYTDEVFENEIN